MRGERQGEGVRGRWGRGKRGGEEDRGRRGRGVTGRGDKMSAPLISNCQLKYCYEFPT